LVVGVFPERGASLSDELIQAAASAMAAIRIATTVPTLNQFVFKLLALIVALHIYPEA